MGLVNREVLLAKVESTYRTDASPVAANDAIQVENVKMNNSGLRMVERKAIRASLAPLQKLYGGRLAELTFDVELKGSGTAGTAPELGTLLRGCAMGETIVASTSVTYKPVSTGFESLTLYYYQDGRLTKITGARGRYTGSVATGDKGKLSFTFVGHIDSRSDTSMVSPTYDAQAPEIILGVNITVGGYQSKVNALEFDVGNEIVTPSDMRQTNGFGEIRVGRREVKGSIDPEVELLATNDYVGDLEGETLMALTTNSIGATPGNILNISMPQISFSDAVDGERDGIRTLDIPFGAYESSGDDEISFVFT